LDTPVTPDEQESDPPLSPEQRRIADTLGGEMVERIDAELLVHANDRPRKVAMLVGLAMSNPAVSVRGLPDLYYAERVRHLVKIGALEARGNLRSMRHSEVKLPGAGDET